VSHRAKRRARARRRGAHNPDAPANGWQSPASDQPVDRLRVQFESTGYLLDAEVSMSLREHVSTSCSATPKTRRAASTLRSSPRGSRSPPNRARSCEACGWTSYPQADPVNCNRWIVEWKVPANCNGCGVLLELGTDISERIENLSVTETRK
jgi:hypothetical protein